MPPLQTSCACLEPPENSPPLHILLLADQGGDEACIHAALGGEGMACEFVRVDQCKDFITALRSSTFDLVLSAGPVGDLDELTALKITQEEHALLPFLLVCKPECEKQALAAVQKGAADYVLKGSLARLGFAVRRAVKDVAQIESCRRLEEQFIQAQKMEVVGQLASGVAHDFNNILAVIMGYSELIISDISPDNAIHQDAQEIRSAAERATALTRQLLIFSRKENLQPVVLDINTIADSMDKMLRQLIGETIELTVIPGEKLGRIKADPGYVAQVLMNLVVNARDAMPNGGRLTIETRNITSDDNYALNCADASPDGYVMLAVTDTGVGMAEEVRARIFEPFFTTKPKGKGTGLGLATCQTIVKQCGGHMSVQTELGKGSTFRVFFPRVDEPLQAPPRTDRANLMPHGTETVLFVEDEPAVRDLACAILEGQDYTVLRATNGQDGLRVAREHHGNPIRLVITDVVMPQMGGTVMAEWLKAAYPDMKILFTSGYTDEDLAHHGVLDPGVDFLPKPYTPAVLATKVREILDAPQ